VGSAPPMPRACRIRDVLSATAALPLGSRAAAGGIALTSPRASRPPGTPHAQRERETSERVRAYPLGALLARCLALVPSYGASGTPPSLARRAGTGDRTFAGACVCGARAAQVPLPRALEIRFPMRPHLVARFESGRDPARSRKLGGGRKKRGGASIPAAAVAWRGVALSAYPTGYHTMPCIPGVARVHDGWEWLSYSRTRRADGGTRTAARCTPRCGRLVFVFFPTPPSPRRACRRRPCVPPLPFLF
jgi:hypothetical protein